MKIPPPRPLMTISIARGLASACFVAAASGCASSSAPATEDSGASAVDSGLDVTAAVDSGTRAVDSGLDATTAVDRDAGTNHDAGDAGGASVPLTDAVLFRVDSSGTNLKSSGGHIDYGVWNARTGVQNIPGNYVVRFFLSTSPSPGPTDLFPLVNTLSAALSPGANTFYLFADGDDMQGGSYGFGLNLWLNGAPAGSPTISAFVGTGDAGSAFTVNGTTGCTPGFDALCTPASSALSWTQGAHTVTLTSFSVSAVGGAAASASCVDKVGADNTSPAVTNMPDGVCDTVGAFTLTVQ